MARRSTSRSTSPRHLVAGVILAPHGIRGELKVAPDTDNAERFRPGRRVLVEGDRERAIEGVRGGGGDLIVRLEGINGRESASKLRGRVLLVPIEDARDAARGVLWADLVGLTVEDESGQELGAIVDVLRPGGGADVLVMRGLAGEERLLPAIADVVLSIDVAGRRVVVRPQQEA
jgi:16S rRNA processing protein RimM